MPEQSAAAPVADPVVPATVVADPAAPAVDPASVAKPADPVADPAKPVEAAKPADPAKPVVPETYEFKAPEGVTFVPEITDKVSAFGKKYGLPQEAIDELSGLGGDISKHIGSENTGALAKAREEWTTSSKTDKEFGGANFDANLGMANKVFETFGTPELKQLLVDSGLSNHPEMIRWAYRVSKEFSPDRFVAGSKPAEGNKTLEQKLYPNHQAA